MKEMHVKLIQIIALLASLLFIILGVVYMFIYLSLFIAYSRGASFLKFITVFLSTSLRDILNIFRYPGQYNPAPVIVFFFFPIGICFIALRSFKSWAKISLIIGLFILLVLRTQFPYVPDSGFLYSRFFSSMIIIDLLLFVILVPCNEEKRLYISKKIVIPVVAIALAVNLIAVIQTCMPAYYYKAGVRFNRLGQPQQAVASFNKVIKFNPSYLKESKWQFDFYHEFAEAQFKLGNYQEAIALYKKILNSHPMDAQAYRHLASVYAQSASDNDKQALQEALRCMEKYFEIRKDRVTLEDWLFIDVLRQRIAK